VVTPGTLVPVIDREGYQVARSCDIRSDVPHPVGRRKGVDPVADPVDDATGKVGIAIPVKIRIDVLIALHGLLLGSEIKVPVQVNVNGVIHARLELIHHQHCRAFAVHSLVDGVGMRPEVIHAALARGPEGVEIAWLDAADGREAGAERAVAVVDQAGAGPSGAGVRIVWRVAKNASTTGHEVIAQIVVVGEIQHRKGVEHLRPAGVGGPRV